MARKITAQIIPGGLSNFIKDLEAAEKDVKANVEDLAMTAAKHMQNAINNELMLHYKTGVTVAHEIEPMGRWEMDHFKVDVGVWLSGDLMDMKQGEGGYAVLLMEYGTPRKKGKRFIGNAVRRNKKALHSAVLNRYNEILGGV